MNASATSLTGALANEWPLHYAEPVAWPSLLETHAVAGVGLPPIRVTVRTSPVWLTEVVDRLTELRGFAASTPGYASDFDLTDLEDAINFLFRVMRDETPLPWIGILNSGGVQLTWDIDQAEIEAIFDHAEDDTGVLIENADTSFELSIEDAAQQFQDLVSTDGITDELGLVPV